jgi:hypothetical protein
MIVKTPVYNYLNILLIYHPIGNLLLLIIYQVHRVSILLWQQILFLLILQINFLVAVVITIIINVRFLLLHINLKLNPVINYEWIYHILITGFSLRFIWRRRNLTLIIIVITTATRKLIWRIRRKRICCQRRMLTRCTWYIIRRSRFPIGW